MLSKEYNRILTEVSLVQKGLDEVISSVDFNKLTDRQAKKITCLAAINCLLGRNFE
jgi:hypothetical protein